MLFSSYEFIFLFLPLFYCSYFLTLKYKPVYREWVILVFSCIFYMVYSVEYTLLLALSIIVNHYLANQIEQSVTKENKKLILITGIIANLLAIAYFKYSNFFLDNISLVTGHQFTALNILLPLGISFFTFQQIAFLVDSYKNGNPHYNLTQYAVFVSFFPQLIAGPIVHHKHFVPQLLKNSLAHINKKNIIIGLSIFAIGLFKKVVIADSFSIIPDKIFGVAEQGQFIPFCEAWLAAISYSFQIYFDFSGYSDMAIGMALVIGIWLPVNFNSPYKSLSIIEFWRTWHITLSDFLKNYLYIPLGGNRIGKFSKYKNLIIVMLLGGLWHGAAWTFVAWGALHGVYLMVNHAWRYLFGNIFANNIIFKLCSWLLTMAAVIIAWVFFRAESFNGAIEIIRSMFMLSQDYKLIIPYSLETSLLQKGVNIDYRFFTPGILISNLHILDAHFPLIKYAVALFSAVVLFAPNTLQLFYSIYDDDSFSVKSALTKPFLTWKPNLIWGIIIGIILIASILMLSQATEFIYFEF